ncbi:hypothetical protein FIBSPDRAFT_962496 [Athelia psychrophila]|uniref:Uncharacterized protein n=1 Tax=Athelia psychrophila TaxID=1759441 RepID=A0A166A260_9AGAM|nr:hypothetical protein FIBSPDRAFT_962496 [Fibularhizoctonia sp. CBS 109695]
MPSAPGDDRDYFGSKPLFYVPEQSAIFNIIIHAIYRISCARHPTHPAFAALLAAIAALPKYGVDLHASNIFAPTSRTPPSPLSAQLLVHAFAKPDRAFDLYALAVAFAHLRALPLPALTDNMSLAEDADADLQESEIRAAFSPVAVVDRVDLLCARWAMVLVLFSLTVVPGRY